jgi:hypothetical protein
MTKITTPLDRTIRVESRGPAVYGTMMIVTDTETDTAVSTALTLGDLNCLIQALEAERERRRVPTFEEAFARLDVGDKFRWVWSGGPIQAIKVAPDRYWNVTRNHAYPVTHYLIVQPDRVLIPGW